jgi:hypothetical protein
MAENYVLLEAISLSASAASITFDNFPSTGYTDLKIVLSARTDYNGTNDGLSVRFNGINTAYSFKQLYGDGASAASNSGSSSVGPNVPGLTATANTFGNAQIYIPNYTSGNNKSYVIDGVGENNTTTAIQSFLSVLWSNVASITSINILSSSGSNLVANSTFSLYGLAATGTTPVTAPFASGGDRVENDGTYWIHTFTSSGAFTPLKALTCDYLVLAGGGGGMGISSGGAYGAPGGGAGGYRTSVGTSGRNSSAESPLSLTSGEKYAVTVGAGGAANTVGSDSILSTITSLGGGTISNGATVNGGSGGGAFDFSPQNTPGAGTANQGFGGGTSPSATSPGGGGGAGGAGSTARQGGVGITSSISGSSVGRGGGGGGGYTSSSNATDGGGSGGISPSNNGSPGTATTGGGGGGGAATGTTRAGAAGGSGIVIIRYPMSS